MVFGADGGREALSAIMESVRGVDDAIWLSRSVCTSALTTCYPNLLIDPCPRMKTRNVTLRTSDTPRATSARSAQLWLVAIVTVVALLASACGDSSDDGGSEASSDGADGFGIGDDDDGGDDDDDGGDGGDDDDQTSADDTGDDGASDAGEPTDDGDDGTTREGDPYLDLPIGVSEAVEFDTDRSSAVRNGSLAPDLRDVYVLEVSQGQILTAVLDMDGGSMALTGPFGERLAEDVTNLNLVLPDDGDYTITLVSEAEADYTFAVGVRDQRDGEPDPTTTTTESVTTTTESVTTTTEAPSTTTEGVTTTTEAPAPATEVEFPPLVIGDIALLEDVEIGIDEEIRFAPGESGDVIENAVVLGQRNIHRFEAAAGQLLALDLASLESNAVFSLIDPSGAVVGTELDEISQILEFSGDYWIIMGSTRGNATYTLFITIV